MESTTQPSTLKINTINLIYLGLLPLLAMVVLFHSPERWSNFSYAVATNQGFIIYTLIGFFLAGIFGVIFTHFVPLPKTIFWSIVMLVDAPLQIIIANYFGSDFSTSQLIIIDLEIETIGLALGSMFVVVKSKSDDTSDTKVLAMLAMIFGAIFASGYFGAISFNWIIRLPILQQLSYYFALVSTAFMYFFAIGKTNLADQKFTQNTVLQYGIKFGLIGVWLYTAIILFSVIFKL